MTAAGVLRKARALIANPKKWGKGEGQTPPSGGRLCVGLAIMKAGGDYPEFDIFRRIVGTSHVHDWQDAPERTHAEVMAAFSRAIELAVREETIELAESDA